MLREQVRERIRSMERRELAGLAVVAALVLAGVGVWYVRSLPSPIRVVEEPPLPRGAGPDRPGAPSPSPRSILVHVAGWVRRPGVYELPEGARVIDALRMAGGARSRADLTSINLAAVLSDGQQVLVQRRGAASAPPPGPSAGAGPAPGGPDALINLNTATLDQLESLPGIGPALAQRIIDYREQNGPFRSVEDLLEVSGIGEKRLADIRSKVTV